MATTTAPHYLLAHVEEGGDVREYRALGPTTEKEPAAWAVRLGRFWPANRPGAANDPWNRRSSVGRDRGALCLRVGPLLRTAGDLDATAVRIFDVAVRDGVGGDFPPIELDFLLPARVRSGDGLILQADLVDVSLFTTLDQIMEEAGRIIERRPWPGADLTLSLSDTMALYSDVAGAVLAGLWRGVLHPSGLDARAWDPNHAQFHLHGPSVDRSPRVRPGTYLIAGLWAPLSPKDLRYDPVAGLCHVEDRECRVAANVLEFELIGLRS